jgi:hypothetical protein
VWLCSWVRLPQRWARVAVNMAVTWSLFLLVLQGGRCPACRRDAIHACVLGSCSSAVAVCSLETTSMYA